MDSSSANPYSTYHIQTAEAASMDAAVDFGSIIRRWEIYRLWYNGVLILYVLAWTVRVKPDVLLEGLYWMQLCLLGLIANVFFCLGPTAEGYGRYLRLWHVLLGRLILLCGLAVTGVFATGFLLGRLR